MNNEQRDVLASLDRLRAQKASQKEENRRRFPKAAAFKDLIDAEFGESKLIFAEEGGNRVGRDDPQPWAKWTVAEVETKRRRA